MRQEATDPSREVTFRPPSTEAADDAVRTVLFQDHGRLERQFTSIVTEAFRNDPSALRQAWQAFTSEVVHHLDDEEEHILPAFAQQKPTEARAFLYEHQRIRDALTRFGVDLDLHSLSPERIADFVANLRAHARREDDLLYPWAAHRAGEAARQRAHRAVSNTEERPMTDSETWQIDLARSSLRFSLRHIVVHEIRGRFRKWGGTVILDGHHLARSSARIWIDLGSVDTDEAERDAQIRSAEFFDLERFPQATFASTQISLPEHANPVMRGRLDLHGFTGDLELEITRHDRWTDDKGSERLSYEARARLDRRKFGLRWNQDLDVGGVVLGDEIELFAELEAVRVDTPA